MITDVAFFFVFGFIGFIAGTLVGVVFTYDVFMRMDLMNRVRERSAPPRK